MQFALNYNLIIENVKYVYPKYFTAFFFLICKINVYQSIHAMILKCSSAFLFTKKKKRKKINGPPRPQVHPMEKEPIIYWTLMQKSY